MTHDARRITIAPDDAGRRLDAVLAPLCPGMGLRGRRRLCDEGLVLVNGHPRRPGHHVATGDEVVLVDAADGTTGQGKAGPSTTGPSTTGTDTAEAAMAARTSAGTTSPEGTACDAEALLPAPGPVADPTGHPKGEDPLAPLRPGGEAHAAGLRLILPLDGATDSPPPTGGVPRLVAVYKPGGLHSAALAGGRAPNAENLLPALKLLNRLDGPTSGILMLAGDTAGERQWRKAEDDGGTRKTYLAVCTGRLERGTVVRAALDTARRTVTRVRPCDTDDRLRHTEVVPLAHLRLGDLANLITDDTAGAPACDETVTLVCCRIRKGARHQIRAHMAHIGHPLLGDDVYAAPASPPPGRMPLFLHHSRITLPGFSAACLPSWLECLPDAVAAAARRILLDDERP